MANSTPPPYFAVWFPFFFAGLWCVICSLLSLIGGWGRLAAKYPLRTPPSGQRFSMQGGKVGPVSYSGCLILHESPEGLYLSILWPFRLGHPPIFIPWGEIHHARVRRFLWVESVSFEVGLPPIATLQLPKKVFDGHAYINLSE